MRNSPLNYQRSSRTYEDIPREADKVVNQNVIVGRAVVTLTAANTARARKPATRMIPLSETEKGEE